jgi:hypothetical protein
MKNGTVGAVCPGEAEAEVDGLGQEVVDILILIYFDRY